MTRRIRNHTGAGVAVATAHRSLSGTQPSRVVPSFRIRYPPIMQSIYKMQAISNQVMSGSHDYDDVAKKSAHVKVSDSD